jgi:hypothetical protein
MNRHGATDSTWRVALAARSSVERRQALRHRGVQTALDDVPRVKNKFCVDTRAVDGKRASIQF